MTRINSIKILFIVCFLFLKSTNAQDKISPINDKAVDSLAQIFIAYTLNVNGQDDAYKQFVESTSKAFNYKSIQDFLKTKKGYQVEDIKAYEQLLAKIGQIKQDPKQNLDSLFTYYRNHTLLKKNLRTDTSSFDYFENQTRNRFKYNLVLHAREQSFSDNSTAESKKNSSSKNQFFFILTGFISGCLPVGLIWYIRSRSYSKTNPTKMIVGQGNLTNYENNNYNINELQSKIRELELVIEKKKLIEKRAEDKIAQLEEELEKFRSIESPDKSTVDEVLAPSIVMSLYFPSPLSDGSFRKVDGKSQFLEGASIYKFTLISDVEAKFEFCDDSSSVSMALNNRNDLILSVADEMEGSATNAKRILTYKGMAGKAILEDNKWIVKQKAKIKYL